MAKKATQPFDLNLNGEKIIDLVDDMNQPRRNYRHTQHQIQELEAFFKDDPNPDDRQRRALGLELGLEPQQVKHWFQNKRIQLKTRHGHQENMKLHAENARLTDENTSHKENLKNVACVSCGNPLVVRREMSDTEHRLNAENVQLRAEIDRLSAIAAQYLGSPVTDSNNTPHGKAP